MSASPTDATRRVAGRAALGVIACLLATVDGRSYGLIPDGKEMLSAGTAVARFFEIGVSRDFVNAPRRPGGDAVSRYGMGLSLVELLPVALARATGVTRTAPLFVLVPILSLAGCAWAAARALERLGAASAPAVVFGAGLVLATPLWGYASSDYGEPLQALCVALAALGVVELRASPASRGWQVVVGIAGGFAILTKTLLVLVVAPLLACALTRRGRGEQKFVEGPLLFSFTGVLGLWFLFELARFGKPFGGYAGETFTYPFFTGLLRLTLFPNKGLLWYAPVVLLAAPGFVALRRRDSRLALALAASALALLFASSAWWAWDGQAGWGPRLTLPALPCLLVLAGVAFSESGRAWQLAGVAAVALGVAVNVLGALVPFPAVYALSSQIVPQPITESRAAGTPYEIGSGEDGVLRATAPHHLSLTPAWSPIRVHALVLAARLRGGFDGSLPQLDPPFGAKLPPSPAPALRLVLSPVRIGWGREFFEGGSEGDAGSSTWADPYFDALRDQLVRAIDTGDFARAASLGDELTKREEKTFSNDPRTVALVAEMLRLGGGQAPGAQMPGAAMSLSYLSKKSSPSSPFFCHPWILFVRAMAEPPGDFSCLPEGRRKDFERSVAVARQRGWPLTAWNRAVTAGRP